MFPGVTASFARPELSASFQFARLRLNSEKQRQTVAFDGAESL